LQDRVVWVDKIYWVGKIKFKDVKEKYKYGV